MLLFRSCLFPWCWFRLCSLRLCPLWLSSPRSFSFRSSSLLGLRCEEWRRSFWFVSVLSFRFADSASVIFCDVLCVLCFVCILLMPPQRSPSPQRVLCVLFGVFCDVCSTQHAIYYLMYYLLPFTGGEVGLCTSSWCRLVTCCKCTGPTKRRRCSY